MIFLFLCKTMLWVLISMFSWRSKKNVSTLYLKEKNLIWSSVTNFRDAFFYLWTLSLVEPLITNNYKTIQNKQTKNKIKIINK